MELRILPSARKRRIPDEDIAHAYHFALWVGFDVEGDMLVRVGVARDGKRLLEVGYSITEDGEAVVFHAMSAREKYLRRME